ncbi:MAG: prepilin-type N-terminal cleavage/methylation domain-containing protein [Patescibacteria group bacterium]
MRLSSRSGFTLVEIIVVMAIISFMASITIPFMSSYLSQQQLSTLTDEVVGNLRRAQNKAITSTNNVSWGVAWHSTYYAIIEDPSGVATEYEVYTLPANSVISGSDIIFSKLSGKTTANTITITATSINEQKQININDEGSIEIQY